MVDVSAPVAVFQFGVRLTLVVYAEASVDFCDVALAPADGEEYVPLCAGVRLRRAAIG